MEIKSMVFVFVFFCLGTTVRSFAQNVESTEIVRPRFRWGLMFQSSPSEFGLENNATSFSYNRVDDARWGVFAESQHVGIDLEFSGVSFAARVEGKLWKSSYLVAEYDCSYFYSYESSDSYSDWGNNNSYFDPLVWKTTLGFGHKFWLSNRFVFDLTGLGGVVESEDVFSETMDYPGDWGDNNLTKAIFTQETDPVALIGGRAGLELRPRIESHWRHPMSLFVTFEYMYGFPTSITKEVSVKEWIETNEVYYEKIKYKDLSYYSMDFRLGFKWYLGRY